MCNVSEGEIIYLAPAYQQTSDKETRGDLTCLSVVAEAEFSHNIEWDEHGRAFHAKEYEAQRSVQMAG